jgi:AraC-like DNA-binding protein
VRQNNQRVILNKNDIFLLDCYHPHIYGTFKGSRMEIIWVHFDGPMIRGYFKQIANDTNCSVLKAVTPSRAKIIYDNLYNIYEKFDKKKGVNDILNNKYIVAIITEFLQGNQITQVPEDSSWDDLLAYISENVQKPLKPKDLAKQMALSPYYFIRKFKKKIGYTPYHYILLTKMSTANHLLRYSSMSIKEIAHACGFSSEGSFYNAFKKIFGIWPRAYRSNMN